MKFCLPWDDVEVMLEERVKILSGPRFLVLMNLHWTRFGVGSLRQGTDLVQPVG